MPHLFKTMSARKRIAFSMAFVITSWGLTATVEAMALKSLSPLQFAMWGTIFGTIGAFVLTFATGSGSQLASFSLREHAMLALLSVLGFSGYFALKFTSFILSPVPQANVLQYTFTIFIVLFAVPILKQRLTLVKCISIFIGFSGAVVVSTGGHLLSPETADIPGYLSALGAGVSFALFSVLSEKASFPRIPALVYFHGYSAALITVVLALQNEIVIPAVTGEYAAAFYSGFVSNVLGIFLWLTAQNEARDVSTVTGLLYLVPFVSLMSLGGFLGLPVPLSAFAGLALIVTGLLVNGFGRRRGGGNS